MQIVNEVFDFVRIDAGSLVLESVVFSLPRLAADVHSAVADAAGVHRRRLRLELDDELPCHLIGDPLRLGQVLENLLAHAIAAHPRASVVLQVRLVGRDAGVAGLRFAVSECGPALSAEQAEALFNPFDAPAHAQLPHGGTALGMPSAQHLVRRMGGLIEALRTPGGGNEFVFRLDLACAPEPGAVGLANGNPA